MEEVTEGLRELIRSRFGGATVERVEALGRDLGSEPTTKAAGYGRPVRLEVRLRDGSRKQLVLHTALPGEFGHERRSDRADELLLAFDTYPQVPRQAAALDVGAIGPGGRYLSLRESGEFYLLTEYAAGRPYADDLRRIAERGEIERLDLERCRALSRYLAELHRMPPASPGGYRRAVRDLVGHGEGIFGVVDGYPDDVPGTEGGARLWRIERKAAQWRQRLRAHEGRLARTHGDFHPFNVLFGEGTDFAVLDASRGCVGEPADDVTAMAINFLFFAVDRPRAWREGLSRLWRDFWRDYLERSRDEALLSVAAPFFAWRALVVCNPRFYPSLSARGREALLGLAERALDAPRFDLEWPEALFR